MTSSSRFRKLQKMSALHIVIREGGKKNVIKYSPFFAGAGDEILSDVIKNKDDSPPFPPYISPSLPLPPKKRKKREKLNCRKNAGRREKRKKTGRKDGKKRKREKVKSKKTGRKGEKKKKT